MQRDYERYIDDYGLRLARGKFTLTKDDEVLKQLVDAKKMTRPSFEYTKQGHNDTIDTIKI